VQKSKFFHLENKGSTLLQNINFIATATRTSNLTPHTLNPCSYFQAGDKPEPQRKRKYLKFLTKISS
jgi:hypothetical protein